jgi:Transglycosylase SLT domain/Sel1 repeat
MNVRKLVSKMVCLIACASLLGAAHAQEPSLRNAVSDEANQDLCTLPASSAPPPLACTNASSAAAAASAPSAATVKKFEATPETALMLSLREEALALEHGNGLERDGARAAALYCRAARLGDVQSQFNLGWMYTNGRGVERNELTAAFFFQAAADQGMEQAQRMLRLVGGPTSEVPDCLREPSPAVRSKTTKPSDVRNVTFAIRSKAPKNLVDIVQSLAPEFRVSPDLVLSVMQTESGFNTVAVSPRNAKGLMQLIPETAARFGVRNPYDPVQNIRGGMAYLRWLLAYFEGDVSLVVAAYNAGEGAVERFRGIPPYLETRAYVRRVTAGLSSLSHPFDSKVARPSAFLRAIHLPRKAQ